MKADTLVIIAAAGAGLFVIYKLVKKPADNKIPAIYAKTNEVANTALPGQPGWGWTYYTDGTSIGPDGKYYFQGTEVYNPAGIMGAA